MHLTRALLHPLYLLALALLILNDHLLKSHLLFADGLLTGKLSDFAGLLVAPLILSIFLRVRTQRGWIATHIATGVGFTALQLSSTVAHAVETTTATIGLPWRVWPDPWDLIALPILALSAHVFAHAASQPSTLASRAKRAATHALFATGAFASIATSYHPPRHPATAEVEQFQADAFLHNATDSTAYIHFYDLDTNAVVDCQALSQGSSPPEDAWSEIGAFSLFAGESAPLRRGHPTQRGCHAARIVIGSSDDLVVFWWDGAPATRIIARAAPPEPNATGYVTLEPNNARSVEGLTLFPYSPP